jgi:hypothetical protein
MPCTQADHGGTGAGAGVLRRHLPPPNPHLPRPCLTAARGRGSSAAICLPPNPHSPRPCLTAARGQGSSAASVAGGIAGLSVADPQVRCCRRGIPCGGPRLGWVLPPAGPVRPCGVGDEWGPMGGWGWRFLAERAARFLQRKGRPLRINMTQMTWMTYDSDDFESSESSEKSESSPAAVQGPSRPR